MGRPEGLGFRVQGFRETISKTTRKRRQLRRDRDEELMFKGFLGEFGTLFGAPKELFKKGMVPLQGHPKSS